MNFFSRRKRPRNIVPISDTAPWILYGSQRTKKNENPQRAPSQQINSKLYVFLGDITELQVDSIVNAANNTLLGGGGVDGAIHAAAGPGLREECSKLGGCSTGDAKITRGHNLPSKHIIHTVGPRGKKPDVLKSCYSKCFELMLENQLKSIAFPCISTGIYGYPNQAAAEVAIETTREFLEVNHEQVEAVIFCLFTNKDIEAYHKLLPAYFPLCSKEDSSNNENASKEQEGVVSEEKEEDSAGEVSKSVDVNVEAEVKDNLEEDSAASENAAKCSDVVSDKDNEEQSDSIEHQNQEEVSQEQTEAMSQEQSEAMSQEQPELVSQESSVTAVEEKEENMSFQEG